MKIKHVEKKRLLLNKKTISQLNNLEMGAVKGEKAGQTDNITCLNCGSQLVTCIPCDTMWNSCIPCIF